MSLFLAERIEVDLLVVNLMLFDHSNHRMRSLKEVMNSLAVMDRHLGELMDGFKPENVIVFGDHGSRRVQGEFLLGDWLRDKGYLARVRRSDQGEADLNFLLQQYLSEYGKALGRAERLVRLVLRKSLTLLPTTFKRQFWQAVERRVPRAFNHYWFSDELDLEMSKIARIRRTGLVYFNRPESSDGKPDSSNLDVQQLVNELKLLADPDNGSPLFASIQDSEELYGVNYQGAAPDLVIDYHGSRFALFTHQGSEFNVRGRYFAMAEDNGQASVWSWRGDHKPEGIFVLSGENIANGIQIGVRSIVDLSATLLHLFNVPVPEDYDGRALTDVFREERAVRWQPGDQRLVTDDYGLSDTEAENEAMILERLRALGYLE
jgi:predicted AlkP superfamily phosphohydrolase/phosphomutase